MAEPPYTKITEERIEMMGSPPNLRLSHFLNPSLINSVDGGQAYLHNLPSDAFFTGDEEKLQQRLKFHMWKNPQKQWEAWVLQMHSVHESVWREAGIHDAIMNSIHIIKPDKDLLLALVERWCPKTNTFAFPWGEATITLEDMMVLGGYSVLGNPVSEGVTSGTMEQTQQQLCLARAEVFRTKLKKACQGLWLRKFMGSGSPLEHEAFLSLWLSRFVFLHVTSGDTVPKDVLAIAARLATGKRMALAPGVLAGIYKNLSKLKNDDAAYTKPKFSAPLQLLQIWAWERFRTLQPTPRVVGPDKPRFYKWSGLKRARPVDVKLAMANAADNFNWRPYKVDDKSVFSSKIFRNMEELRQIWILLDEEEVVDEIIRCVRVSELVGIDCIEQYLPHRVAMQFGLDQDRPRHVPRTNADTKVAWEYYKRPIHGGRLLVPTYLLRPDVTTDATFEYFLSLKSISDLISDQKLKRKPYKSVFANAAVYKGFLKNKYLKLGNGNDNLAPPKREESSADINGDSELPIQWSKKLATEGMDEEEEDINLNIPYEEDLNLLL